MKGEQYTLTIQIYGQEYKIIRLNFETYREADVIGLPTTPFHVPSIECTLPFTGNDIFFEWISDPKRKETISIVFRDKDNGRVLETMYLEDTYLMSYRLLVDQEHPSPTAIYLKFSARRVDLGGRKFGSPWPD